MEGEEDESQDEKSLEDEAGAGGEGVTATKVAAVVEAVKGFKPTRGFFAEVTQSGEVVGKHRANRPGQ